VKRRRARARGSSARRPGSATGETRPRRAGRPAPSTSSTRGDSRGAARQLSLMPTVAEGENSVANPAAAPRRESARWTASSTARRAAARSRPAAPSFEVPTTPRRGEAPVATTLRPARRPAAARSSRALAPGVAGPSAHEALQRRLWAVKTSKVAPWRHASAGRPALRASWSSILLAVHPALVANLRQEQPLAAHPW